MKFFNSDCPILLYPIYIVCWLFYFLLSGFGKIQKNPFLHIKGKKRKSVVINEEVDEESEVKNG